MGFGRTLLALLVAVVAVVPAAAQAQSVEVAREVELTGTVDPATAAWMDSALREAAQDRVELVIVRLDTPGGLDSSMPRPSKTSSPRRSRWWSTWPPTALARHRRACS